MNEFVICLDIGSSFTKVALRLEARQVSRLLQLEDEQADLVSFVVPSVVAALDANGRREVLFGARAFNLRPGSGIHHFTNWKRDVFADEPPLPKPTGWEAFLASDELRQLAQQFGIPATEVEQLNRFIDQARIFLKAPTLQRAKQTAARSPRDRARNVAIHFLTWLRGETLRVIREQHPSIREPETIPVRMTVPAFTVESQLAEHSGCQLYAEALARAGWHLHPQRGFISEPLAQIIGVLTGGENAVSYRHPSAKRRAERETINLGEMFGKGPFIQAMKDATRYRALVVDLGTFTTDFAVLDFDPRKEVVSEPDQYIAARLTSMPLGISNVDDRVREVFAPGQRDYITANIAPFQWSDIRRRLYSRREEFRLADGSSLGEGQQRSAIDTILATFAEEVEKHAIPFFGPAEPSQLTDLILTGGGMLIPMIRDLFRTRLHEAGYRFHNVYIPSGGQNVDQQRRAGRPRVTGLTDDLVRGGSALGGASVFFERSFY